MNQLILPPFLGVKGGSVQTFTTLRGSRKTPNEAVDQFIER